MRKEGEKAEKMIERYRDNKERNKNLLPSKDHERCAFMHTWQ